MAYSKRHYYMCAALIHYLRDGQPKQREMNIYLALREKKITSQDIHDSRVACLERLTADAGVKPEDVINYTVLNMFYCGHMTEKEFQNIEAPRPH